MFSFNGNKIITTSGGGMLVSDDASYLTGTTVTVDGGMTAYPSFAHGG